jgi:hypothetical protein
VVNVLEVPTLFTILSTTNDDWGDGKIVVVIPDPEGHVIAIPDMVIGSFGENP